MKESLYQAIVVTAEVVGHEMSTAAAKAMAQELASYPPEQVAKALQRCKRELSGRLTLAAVLQRIDDGHLSADEAWALLPRSEADTVVWTDEMANAYEVCRGLLDHDEVAARMAFREAYTRRLQEARAQKRAAMWWASMGSDPGARQRAIRQAVDLGRLTSADERRLLGTEQPAPVRALPPTKSERSPTLASDIGALLQRLKGG